MHQTAIFTWVVFPDSLSTELLRFLPAECMRQEPEALVLVLLVLATRTIASGNKGHGLYQHGGESRLVRQLFTGVVYVSVCVSGWRGCVVTGGYNENARSEDIAAHDATEYTTSLIKQG